MRNMWVNSSAIKAFVSRVETKKGYRRDPGLVLRHLFEEIGECSHKLWNLEKMSTEGLAPFQRRAVSKELVDIICLSVWLADVVGVDVDSVFSERLNEVAKQYGVFGVKCEKRRASRARGV